MINNLICSNPWMEIQIEYNFNIGCCCYYNGIRPKWNFLETPKFVLQNYWNNDFFQQLRKIVINNEYFNSGCKNCQELILGFQNTSSDHLTKLNTIQKENYLKAIYNLKNKKTVIDNLPVRYYFNFGLDCNLNCIMCSQKHLRRQKYHILPSSIFENLQDYFPYAERITLVGGEPLLIRDCIYFIDKFSKQKQLEDVTLGLITNGTLLDKYLPLLRRIKRLNIAISLDAIEETYEYIRKGSSWKKVEKNILKIKNLIDESKLEWSISINCVVMKSNLKEINSFFKWIYGNNLKLTIVPVVNNNLNNAECIFDFPQLLDEIPEWEEIIAESIDILENYDLPSSKRLKILFTKLKQSYLTYKQNKNFYPKERIYLNNRELIDYLNQNGKFMIWGTGSFYKNNFSRFIKTKPSNFLGFIDNNSSLWDSELDGFKVFSPDVLFKLKPNSILIASMFIKEIKTQIMDMGIDFCKVY